MDFSLLDGSYFDALLSCFWLIPAGFLLVVIVYLVALPIRLFIDFVRGGV